MWFFFLKNKVKGEKVFIIFWFFGSFYKQQCDEKYMVELRLVVMGGLLFFRESEGQVVFFQGFQDIGYLIFSFLSQWEVS